MKRWPLLGALLLGVLLLVPDAAVQPTQVALVKVHRASGVALGDDDIIWIAAIGSDARPGEDMSHSRGDALQLIGIDTRTGAAAAIGIPRDSWVSVPGAGNDKINTALYYGGPQGMAQAMGDLVGIQPDYAFVTRFPFFENMIDDIGGITVYNPRAFTDPYLKPQGFREGRIRLDGYGAMAFSRVRKAFSDGDFERSANQQRTLRGILGTIRARADEPGFLARGVLTVLRNTTTDLPPAELYQLAVAVSQVDPAKVTSCVVRGGYGYVGEASVVFPDTALARRLGDRARTDATLESCT